MAARSREIPFDPAPQLKTSPTTVGGNCSPIEDVCAVAWHSARAGGAGCGGLALDPTQAGAHHADHLRQALRL
eukprot:6029349-Pyramimonas_sp.AAC.1